MRIHRALAYIISSHAIFAESRSVSRSVGNFPFAGCGKSLPQGQSTGKIYNISITSSGLGRSYLVFIPPRYNAHVLAPLILSYHGGNRNASQQLELDELTSPEFNTDSMVVYPQGIDVRIYSKLLTRILMY